MEPSSVAPGVTMMVVQAKDIPVNKAILIRYLSMIPSIDDLLGIYSEGVSLQKKQESYAELLSNHPEVFLQIDTSISITGTSMSTPTTVARAAPD